MRSPRHQQPTRPQPPSNLSTMWTSHLKDQGLKESFEAKLYNMSNDPMVLRLMDILEKKKQELLRREHSFETYDSPSWSHKQAHINGEMAMITLLDDLFNFAKGPKNK